MRQTLTTPYLLSGDVSIDASRVGFATLTGSPMIHLRYVGAPEGPVCAAAGVCRLIDPGKYGAVCRHCYQIGARAGFITNPVYLFRNGLIANVLGQNTDRFDVQWSGEVIGHVWRWDPFARGSGWRGRGVTVRREGFGDRALDTITPHGTRGSDLGAVVRMLIEGARDAGVADLIRGSDLGAVGRMLIEGARKRRDRDAGVADLITNEGDIPCGACAADPGEFHVAGCEGAE